MTIYGYISSVTLVNKLSLEAIQSTVDANGKIHNLVILPEAANGIKKRALTQPCKYCEENYDIGTMLIQLHELQQCILLTGQP